MSHAHPTNTPGVTPTTASTSAGELKPVGPPSKHQLALMIWIAVFPTLVALNLTIGPWLKDYNVILRTFVLATTAVPVVIYGLMPRLHRLRTRLMTRRPTA
jgi:antibiotic biosynthesis monooxygenase (ABM) superfamily enzyme